MNTTASIDHASRSRRGALALVRPLVSGLQRYGIVPSTFLARIATDEELRQGTVSLERLAAAMDEVAERARIPHLALELARMLPLGALGTSDYCFSTSSTLVDALCRIASHVGHFTEAVRYELHVDGDTARIEEVHLFRPLRILTEFSQAFVARRLRDVLGDWEVRLTAVRFTHQAAGPIAPYEEYFRAPVMFGARVDEVAFPTKLLKTRLLTADAELARMLAEHSPALDPDAAARPLLGQVREQLVRSFTARSGAPTLAEVADRLSMSSRSLQRKLTELGAPYSTILDDVRREHATELVSKEGLLVAHIAHRLGFQSVTAFFRAFRRWTGMSPHGFRITQRRA